MRALVIRFVPLLACALAFAACESKLPGNDVATADAATTDSARSALADAATSDPDAADASVDAATGADAAAAEGSCEGTLPKSVARLGCTKDDDKMNRPSGFSSDDALLGGCVSACDPCPLSCVFRGKNGQNRSFADFYGPTNGKVQALEASKLSSSEIERRVSEIATKETAAFEKNLAALALRKGPPGRPLSGPFPYPDLALVAKGEVSKTTGAATLSFGAAVDGEEPVYPIRISLAPHPTWSGPLAIDAKELAKHTPAERKKITDDLRAELHEQFMLREPEVLYADVTKDGSELGVVAFVTGPMWYEAAAEARMATKTFVARVYDETAARMAKRGEGAAAAKLREKAHPAAK